jgi:transposase
LANETTNVIAGIDTHADTHHLAIINEHGKPIVVDKQGHGKGGPPARVLKFLAVVFTVAAGDHWCWWRAMPTFRS